MTFLVFTQISDFYINVTIHTGHVLLNIKLNISVFGWLFVMDLVLHPFPPYWLYQDAPVQCLTNYRLTVNCCWDSAKVWTHNLPVPRWTLQLRATWAGKFHMEGTCICGIWCYICIHLYCFKDVLSTIHVGGHSNPHVKINVEFKPITSHSPSHCL